MNGDLLAVPVTRAISYALSSLTRPSSGSLRNVVERVVVNPEGTIIRVDLLPPFADLNDLSEKVSGCSGAASEDTAESQTSGKNAGCSNGSLVFWGGRIRTYEWRIQSPLPYHLATPQWCV